MKNEFHWNCFLFFLLLIWLLEYCLIDYSLIISKEKNIRYDIKCQNGCVIQSWSNATLLSCNQNKTRESLKDFRILRILDWNFYQVIFNYFIYIFDIKARFNRKLSDAFFIWCKFGYICDIYSFCTILNFEISVHIFVFNFFFCQNSKILIWIEIKVEVKNV